MAISDFPAALQPIIQTGYLDHRFETGLRATLTFRRTADRETIGVGIGETVTKTRAGLLPAVTAPINVQGVSAQVAATVTANPLLHTAAKLDDGLIPVQAGFEQYTLGMFKYGSTMDLNTRTSRIAIARLFPLQAEQLGEQAARSLDGLAKNALYGAYMGGNTSVRVASTGTSVAVDDVRGFLTAPQGGSMQPVTPSNPLAVVIGAGAYSITAVAVDVSNVSTAAGGMSGVLTLATAVSAGDGAAGNPAVSGIAPSIIRPNGKATAAALTAGDKLTMSALLDAVALLRGNAVPTIDGLYDCYVNAASQRQMFADADFRQLFQGATSEAEAFARGSIEQPFLGLRFVPTTQTPVQPHPTTAGLRVHSPIVVGQGALIEGQFEGTYAPDDGGTADIPGEEVVVDGVRMVTRAPLDRLKEVITQSWEWIGGYCAPTDTTTSATTVASATNAALKRAVVVQHAGT